MSVSDDDVVLIIPPDQYFHSILSNLSHLSHTVSLITSVLTPNQLELFKRSSIGRLIDTDLVFCGPLIHQILLREIKQPDQKIMQFLIGGEVITFSLRSFEEITGLKSTRNYRRHEFNPRLRRLLFDDRVKVPSKELETKMKNHGLSDDGDVVKLALLCFIELVLLGNKRTTLIDTSLLSILDDNESFENYDWAQLFFDKTLFGLSNALKERKCKHGEVVWKKAKSYSLYGFPFAFQVWIYETIPLIANMCARKINNRSMPPIGRWNCNKLIKMDRLERDIFSKDKIVVNEEIDFHMDELVKTVTTEKVDRKRKILLHVKSGEEEKKHKRVEEEEKNKREEVMPKNEGEKSQKSKGLSSSCRTCIKRTDARVEHLEAEVRELRADMKVVLATLKNIEKYFCKGDASKVELGEDALDINEKSREPVEEIGAEIGEDALDMNENCGDGVGEELGEEVHDDSNRIIMIESQDERNADNAIQSEEKTNAEDIMQIDRPLDFPIASSRVARQINPSPQIRSPFVVPKKTVKLAKLRLYDPAHKIPKELTSNFKKWLVNASVDSRRETCYGSPNKKFFQDLVTFEKLDGEHMDTIFMFIRLKVRKKPECMCHQFATVDAFFMSECNKIMTERENALKDGPFWVPKAHFGENSIGDYILGDNRDYSDPWSSVDYVYSAFNVLGGHWVLLQADIKNRRVVIWDSLPTFVDVGTLTDLLRPFCTIVPLLLESVGLINSTDPWPVERMDNVPTQTGGVDCGVFCCKFFEYLVTGSDFTSLKQANIKAFRLQLAIELWSNRPIYT